ncbi:MAG: phosphoribosyltransferase family protein [Caldilineaceae bacterium]
MSEMGNNVPKTVTIPLGGDLEITLPVLPFSAQESVGVLNCVDEEFADVDVLAEALVDRIHAQGLQPDAVLCVPTQGYVLGSMVARRLGLDRVYAVKKSVKIFESAADMVSVTYGSITSGGSTLYMPRVWGESLRDKSVILVEDVIATGGTLGAALDLCDQAGLRVSGIFVAFVEARPIWREKLGRYADQVTALAEIPVYHTQPKDD